MRAAGVVLSAQAGNQWSILGRALGRAGEQTQDKCKSTPCSPEAPGSAAVLVLHSGTQTARKRCHAPARLSERALHTATVRARTLLVRQPRVLL